MVKACAYSLPSVLSTCGFGEFGEYINAILDVYFCIRVE